MKLLLTSTGFISRELAKKFLEKLEKKPNEYRVLMIAYTLNKEEQFYVDESEKEMHELGFKEIVLLNLHNQINLNEILDFDVVYVCGGNTFSILDQIRKKGIDKVIINLVKNGTFYIGASAGSIIAGPDIAISGWGSSGDKNLVNLTNTSGFNLVSFAVYPHFVEEEREFLEQKSKEVNYKIIPITDCQAVYAENGSFNLW